MPRKKAEKQKPLFRQISIFDYIASLDEKKAIDGDYTVFETLLDGIMKFKQSGEEWRGLIAVPPASLLADVINEFSKGTTVPLEIPMMCLMHYIGGYLLKNGICMNDDGRKIYSDIWTQILAASGEGKTYSFEQIGEAMPEFKDAAYNISDPESSAAFFEALQQNNNKLLFRDEWWAMLDKMQSGKALDGVKDYMMRAFNHETIVRRTKKDGEQVIPNVKFSFIGISTAEPVLKRLTDEDFLSGFSARFNYLFADILDENRIVAKFKINHDRLRQHWSVVRDRIKFKEYYPDKDADRAFTDTMQYFMRNHDTGIQRGIIRRTVETAHKYALLYHILRGKGDIQEVSAEDYGWAARMVWLHISDIKRLMKQFNETQDYQLYKRAMKSAENFRIKYGRPPQRREINMRVRGMATPAGDQIWKIIEAGQSNIILPDQD